MDYRNGLLYVTLCACDAFYMHRNAYKSQREREKESRKYEKYECMYFRYRKMFRSREKEAKCKIYGYLFNIAGQMLFGCFHSAGGVPGFQLMDRGIFCCEFRSAC